MTKRADIKVRTVKGHVRTSVKYGWLDLNGVAAVVVIAIILALRLLRVITRLLWAMLVYLTPIVVRAVVGAVLYFRAFYTS